MLMTLVMLFICLRIHIRGYVLKAWGLDDSFFLLSGATDGNLGVHIWNITFDEIRTEIHYTLATVLIYVAAFTSIKMTYLLQYRRAIAVRFMQTFCNVFLVVLFINMCAMCISCGLVMKMLLDPQSLSIDAQASLLTWSYAHSAVQLFTDIIIFIVPLPLLGRLKVSTMQKAGLFASFGVGIFTCTISVLRIITLKEGLQSADIFYESVPLVLLTVAEVASANICICIPILKPLGLFSGIFHIFKRGYCIRLSRFMNKSDAKERKTANKPAPC
ncbi:uncharacterized protein CTRU02_215268 [Colletotrichum truncatum]|uniref:Uncharacterized protein n=1 Tax=Colletotrichum truncatum TaxID=5467 RepID=A0ACC3YDA2_COLTU|nr:uncharacterized protein CTRU02_12309 [Colletotrichum truncatum]KAF6784848.1 hypothetical protein CTRU02_12309 [Colletotrichum truncatum]